MFRDKQQRSCAGAWWRKEGRVDGTHDVGMIETLKHLHLAPRDLRIPFDLPRDSLQYNLVCDGSWRGLSGEGIARGAEGEHRSEVHHWPGFSWSRSSWLSNEGYKHKRCMQNTTSTIASALCPQIDPSLTSRHPPSSEIETEPHSHHQLPISRCFDNADHQGFEWRKPCYTSTGDVA
jgi:hypothetical protein